MRVRVVLASCLVAACALFPEVSNLGGDDAAVTDGPSTIDAASSDATGDATTTSGFCATNPGHTFCEDFDTVGFETRWNGVVTKGSATALESDASFVSKPNQMLASSTFGPNASGINAYAYKHFTSSATIKVQVQVQVDTTQLALLDPITIALNPPPAQYSTYQIHIDIGTSHLGFSHAPTDGGASTTKDANFTNPLATWQLVELDVDLSAQTASVLVGGVIAAQIALDQISPSAFDLRVGITEGTNTMNSSASAVIHIDNVLVDTK